MVYTMKVFHCRGETQSRTIRRREEVGAKTTRLHGPRILVFYVNGPRKEKHMNAQIATL